MSLKLKGLVSKCQVVKRMNGKRSTTLLSNEKSKQRIEDVIWQKIRGVSKRRK